jgi:hypothetical protein
VFDWKVVAIQALANSVSAAVTVHDNFCSETCLSASVNEFLSQVFNAVQHDFSKAYC